MRRREPTTTWLPSTEQIMVAPERAILAALDANLELAIRAIMAEHVDLLPDGRRSRDPDYEPHTFNLLPVAEMLVTCAKRLRRLVIAYRTVADDLLHQADDASGRPSDDSAAPADNDDDIPF